MEEGQLKELKLISKAINISSLHISNNHMLLDQEDW